MDKYVNFFPRVYVSRGKRFSLEGGISLVYDVVLMGSFIEPSDQYLLQYFREKTSDKFFSKYLESCTTSSESMNSHREISGQNDVNGRIFGSMGMSAGLLSNGNSGLLKMIDQTLERHFRWPGHSFIDLRRGIIPDAFVNDSYNYRTALQYYEEIESSEHILYDVDRKIFSGEPSNDLWGFFQKYVVGKEESIPEIQYIIEREREALLLAQVSQIAIDPAWGSIKFSPN